MLAELASLTGGATLGAAADAFAPIDGRVTRASEIGLPLLILALILLPLDIALRRLMLRRSDFGAARAWAAATASRPAAPPPPASPTLERLAGAKRRAAASITGQRAADEAPRQGEQQPATPPAAPPAATPPAEDPLERLRAAKERARRRASGEE
jgi:hypothetical protein